MTKMEDNLINQISTNKGEKNKISKKLNATFDTFFKILDFNELDVNRFLSIKESKKYKSLIRKKVLIFLLYETLILIFWGYNLLWAGYEIEITFWLISRIIIGLIIFNICNWPLGFFYGRILNHFYKDFNYSMPYYRKKKKKMKKSCKQFNLIINNQQLIEEIGEENYINKYKINFEKINNRINYYSNLFRSLDYYIIQFGIFSIVISIFSPIIYEILFGGGIQVININFNVLLFSLLIPIYLSSFVILHRFGNKKLIIKLNSKRNALIEAESSLSSKLEEITTYLQNFGLGFFLRGN